MSVCLSVCLSVDDYSRTTGYEAAYERYQQLQCYKGEKKFGDFAENDCVREIWREKQAEKPICIMSTGLPRPGLVRSAHCGRIKLLRGYVSKSSAALNPLMITQLACELSMRGRSRTALLGPSHELAVRIIVTQNEDCCRCYKYTSD